MVKYTLRKTKITNIIWGIDLKNLLIIASTLAVLGGCGDKAVETPVETASSYLGDCAGAPGETPLLNTVDRDDWGSAGLDLAAMDKRFAEAGAWVRAWAGLCRTCSAGLCWLARLGM